MELFEQLYSRDSKGNIVSWSIKVEGIEFSSESAKIIISEGLLTGKKTETIRTLLKGKNIGKINETIPYDQAIKDVQSRIEKKKKQGYKSYTDLGISIASDTDSNIKERLELVLPINRTDANNLNKPMKAQQYFKDDGTPRIKFPCFGQPKLNGFRVMARWEKVEEGEGIFKQEVEKVVFRSKEGLRYTILEHIEKEFTKDMFFPNINNYTILDGLTLDGEMYIHGEILSEISSAVRKRNPKTEKLKFHIFDVAIEGVKQEDRIQIFLSKLNQMFIENMVTNSTIVPVLWVENNKQAQAWTDDWIKQGYEGGIFRDEKAFYQFGKRPQTMVKLKRSQDKEFKIVDVISGENSPELGMFVCVQEQGLQFTVNPEGSHETKKEYLTNKQNYIGKLLTVKFFERTKDNIPFHSVGIAVRDYE